MSSFTVSATAAVFTDSADNFNEHGLNPAMRQWDVEIFLALATDYTTLRALLSGPYHIGVCPGTAGASYYLDIGGGAGIGTLVLDNVVGSPFTAALVDIARPSAYPGGGRRCRVTFIESPP